MIQTGMSKKQFEMRLQDLHGRYTDRHVSSEVLQTKIAHLKAYGPEELRSLLDGLRDGAYSQPIGWYRALAHLHHHGHLEFSAPEAGEEGAAVPANVDEQIYRRALGLIDSMKKRIDRIGTAMGCFMMLVLPLPFVVLPWMFDLSWWRVALYGLADAVVIAIFMVLVNWFGEKRTIRRVAVEFRQMFSGSEEGCDQAMSVLISGGEKDPKVKDLYQAVLKTPALRGEVIHLSKIGRRNPRWDVGVVLLLMLVSMLAVRPDLVRGTLDAIQHWQRRPAVTQAPKKDRQQPESPTLGTPAAAYPPVSVSGARADTMPPPITRSAESAKGSPQLFNVLTILLPYLLMAGVLGVLFYFLRIQRKVVGSRVEESSNWKQFSADQQSQQTTFRDIAGYGEVKDQMRELANYLQAPEAYEVMGTEIPRAVLMVGPPGTGKTSLARAVAGAAGVTFLYCSGSEFVEIYVGVGAKRVRALFEEARRKAPSIIFIDEVDVVARKRSSGLLSNKEADDTLSELLVQLDGFKKSNQPQVIFIAATNLEDSLDLALLQRMSRRIAVPLPDEATRRKILQQLSSKQPLRWTDVQLDEVASQTAGFSGRELRNLIEESPRQTLKRLHMEAQDWCRNQRGDEEFRVVLPTGEQTEKSPLICAGYTEIGGRVRVKLNGRDSIIDDANEGVWSLLQDAKPGKHVITFAYTRPGEERGEQRGETTVEVTVGEERHEIVFADVEAALVRLGAPIPRIADPMELSRSLDRAIVGQEAAKRVLACAAAAHYANARRTVDRANRHRLATSVVLVGSRGVGKTLLAESLAQCLRVPFSVVDAPTMVRDLNGNSIAQHLLHELVRVADGKTKLAEHGIVVIKDIDEISGHTSHLDSAWSRQAQRTLAELLSGKVVDIATNLATYTGKSVRIDTRHILFILEGEFPELTAKIKRRRERSLGQEYQGVRRTDEETHKRLVTGERSDGDSKRDLLKQLQPQDLGACGLTPELVTCISVAVALDDPSKDDFLRILRTTGDSNLVADYQELLSLQEIDVELRPDAYEAIAEASVGRESGVYGLRAVLHHIYLFLVSSGVKGRRLIDDRLVEQALAWRITEPIAGVR